MTSRLTNQSPVIDNSQAQPESGDGYGMQLKCPAWTRVTAWVFNSHVNDSKKKRVFRRALRTGREDVEVIEGQ